MKRIIFLMLICTLIIAPTPRTKAAPVKLPVPHITKGEHFWCWLAVAEMALAYLNQKAAPSQCRLMEIAFQYPKGYCCADSAVCDRAESLEELARIINEFTGRSARLAPPLEPNDLYKLISENKIIVAFRRDDPPGRIFLENAPPGHVVILRGMRSGPASINDGRGGSRRNEPWVLVNDPDYASPLDVPYRAFRPRWVQTIIID